MPNTALLDVYPNLAAAKEAQSATKERGRRRPIYYTGQPVVVVTPEGGKGYFIMARLGRRVIRLKAISGKQYAEMILGATEETKAVKATQKTQARKRRSRRVKKATK